MKKKISKKVSTRKSGGATGNRSRHFRPDVDGRVVKEFVETPLGIFDLCQDTDLRKSRPTESLVVELDSDRLSEVGYFCPIPFGVCNHMHPGELYSEEECKKCGLYSICNIRHGMFDSFFHGCN